MWPPMQQTFPQRPPHVGFVHPAASIGASPPGALWGHGGPPPLTALQHPHAPQPPAAFPPAWYPGYAAMAASLYAPPPHPAAAGALGVPPGTMLPPPPAGAPVLAGQLGAQAPPPLAAAPARAPPSAPGEGAASLGADILALIGGGAPQAARAAAPPSPPAAPAAAPVGGAAPEFLPPQCDFLEARLQLLAVRDIMERRGQLGPAPVAYRAVPKADLPRALRVEAAEDSDVDLEEAARGSGAGAGASAHSPQPSAELSSMERLVMKAHLSTPQAKRSPSAAMSSPGSQRTPAPALAAMLSPGSKSPGVLPSPNNRAAGAAAGAFLLQLVKETDSPPKDGAELGASLLQQLQGKPAFKTPAGTPEGKSAGSLLLESIQAGKQDGTPTPPKQGVSDNGDDCILEAKMHTDGKRYVKADGEWLVASGKYYCIFCKVFGNTLDEHLASAHHANNRKLHASTAANDEAKHAPKKLWHALSAKAEESEGIRRPRAAREPADGERAKEGDGGPPAALCAPCGEDRPPATNLAERYPDPAEEWLAWVPIKEGDRDGERRLRCLLCSKWASGADHSGAGGSPEHLRNVAKYVHTQSQWYADVLSQKRRWSTSPPRPAGSPAPAADQGSAAAAAACFMQARAPVAPAPLAPTSAPLASPPASPWQSAWSQEHQRSYYWNVATGMVQWDPPPLLPSSR